MSNDTPMSSASPITRLMTVAEVAELLGVPVGMVRRLVQERRIPHVKVGHHVRFIPAEIDGWIHDQHRPDDGAA